MSNAKNSFNLAGVVVSKGYQDQPTVRLSTTPTGLRVANFRGAQPVYDSKANNNTRWVPYDFVAFGKEAERIERMNLSANSMVIISGMIDYESFEGTNGKVNRHKFIIDGIDYYGSSNGGGNKNTGTTTQAAKAQPAAAAPAQAQAQPQQRRAAPAEQPAPNGFDASLDQYDGYAGVEEFDPTPFDI